jgi:hypothetical protein
MMTIDSLTPGTWVSIPDLEPYEETSSGVPEYLLWAWGLDFKDMLVLEKKPSSIWGDVSIVTALAGGQVHTLHIDHVAQFGERTIHSSGRLH